MQAPRAALTLALSLAGCDQLFALQHIPERDAEAADGLAPAPTMCGSAVLHDDFNDGTINAETWRAWADAGASTVEIAQQIVLTLGAGDVEDGRQAELVSVATFDLRGRRVSVEVPTISNLATKLQAVLFIRDDPSNNGFALVAEQGRLYFVRRVAGNYSTVAVDTPYKASEHRFWHLREAGGTVYYAASADGEEWLDLASAPTQIELTGLKVGIYVYMDGAGVDPGYATFDNFHLCELVD